MTEATAWHEVKLYDQQGKWVGRCRAPKAPFLPQILVWANRYFRLTVEADVYREASCFLVPIEHMYVQGAPHAAAAPGAKKQ